MQTVNFNCSHCAKLMAVGINLLGRNVRCPHCKQVVQAPASTKPAEPAVVPDVSHIRTPVVPINQPSIQSHAAPAQHQVPPPPAPNLHLPGSADGQESIFGANTDEDLFGAQSKAPPPPPPAPPRPNVYVNPARNEQTHSFPSAPASPFGPGNAATEELEALPSSEAHWDERVSREDGRTEEFDRPSTEDELPRSTRVSSRPEARSSGGGVFIWMLMLYALIATGIAAYLYYDKTQMQAEHEAAIEASKKHPFLAIPDFFGQYERAERKKIEKIDGMPPANQDVPKELQMRLNETKQFGDLEVTPLKVEYRQANRLRKVAGEEPFTPKSNPTPFLFLLTLRVKNMSNDVYMCPSDPAFARNEKSKPPEVKPYTGLIIGKDYFLGGAFLWQHSQWEYEYLEEQKDDGKPLAPKEERNIVIAADLEWRPIKNALAKAKPNETPILWRVELRRGLETVKDESGKDHEISVTSVFGVVLDRSDFSY